MEQQRAFSGLQRGGRGALAQSCLVLTCGAVEVDCREVVVGKSLRAVIRAILGK